MRHFVLIGLAAVLTAGCEYTYTERGEPALPADVPGVQLKAEELFSDDPQRGFGSQTLVSVVFEWKVRASAPSVDAVAAVLAQHGFKLTLTGAGLPNQPEGVRGIEAERTAVLSPAQWQTVFDAVTAAAGGYGQVKWRVTRASD
jgi:hypothetical protein